MSKSETAARCIAECSACGQIYTAEFRADGPPRPIGIGSCSCGSDNFRQIDA